MKTDIIKEAGIDIAVLLIFFNRPSKIKEVFDVVKEVRPSRLYLYQDGVRPGREDDEQNVKQCRLIVENIDWECRIIKKYQTQNYGCDPSEYIAQRWFFDNEEYGIVLEDDDVPSKLFFPFAKELLEKYKDNERIAIICGMNNYDIEKKTNNSYLFSKRGSIWGWASWRRFINLWDENYTWLNDIVGLKKIKNYCDYGLDYNVYIKTALKHKKSGKAHYESIMFAAASQNDMLNIVPKYNMIKNIGIDKESTHSVSDIRLIPKRIQKLLYKKTYEIEFPLRHPETIMRNIMFDLKFKRTLLIKLSDHMEAYIRKIIYGRKN